jgi:hypothetical protein
MLCIDHPPNPYDLVYKNLPITFSVNDIVLEIRDNKGNYFTELLTFWRDLIV